MTKTQKDYYCRVCDLTFKDDYNPNVQRPRRACPKCHKVVDIKKKNNIPPRNVIDTQLERVTSSPSLIIDDPDELLFSVAIRELNKENPDPRWANILISCKKENINIKGDDIESFRKLPNQVLATLLRKSKQRM